jgi:hypothetical protein
MLNRLGLSRQTKQRHFTSRWIFAVLAALLVLNVAAGAQTSDGADTPGKSSKAEKKNKPAKKSKEAPDSDLPMAKVMQAVAKRGSRTHVPDYIAHDLRLVNVTLQLFAYQLSTSDRERTIYCIAESGSNTALLLAQSEEGDPTVYVTNRAGVLKQAARITTGRMASKNLRIIPLPAAQEGFQTEKEFWIKLLASGDPVPADLANPAK